MKYFFKLFILLLSFSGYSQNVSTVNSKIHEELTGPKLRLDNLLDSVAFYTFAIQLDVTYKDGVTIVEKIGVNDSIAFQLYKDFEFLKKINYASILQHRKKARIVIPVGIILAYTKNKTSTPMIRAETLMSKIYSMYNISYPIPKDVINDYIFLNPVICTCGYKVYD